MKESFGGEVEIYNEYGPTEATVGCAVWRYEEERRGEVPIGRPGANMQVYVLDECKQPVGEQVLGEIYIGGEGLALGYLKRDELTSEKFQEHPFEVGGRVYRTGDIGRWLPGGVLDYIGRRDEQVKYHGYRVELNEIRSALNEHSEVRESVVVMEREDGEPGVLVGYYVSRRELEAGALREFLRERLIEETIPSLFVHLKRMPLTLNGKVNVKALPSVKTARERARLSYEPPRTVVEEILAGIFGGVLKLERVGIRDNFFEFGGHSLLAIQVISQVREKFGVEIGVRNVFEAATVESLSRSVEEAMRAGKKTVAPPLVRADREGGERRAPLSFAQQRLWFLDQLEPGNPFYNILGALELEGRLDLEALEQAINEIVRRHEALRTRFEADNGEPTQVIGAWEATKVEVVNLTGLAPEARAAQARRIARDEAAMGFDLARGLLLRVKALKLEEERHLLLYTMHHIVSDGWSMNILSREVGALYQAYSADSRGKEGQTPVLPEMEIQYADFAVWQRKYLTEGGDQGILASEVRYWKAQLEDAAVLELPTDHPRPMIQSHRGAMERVEIDIEVSEGLRKLSQREGATLFMTLMAAFKILLMRYSGVEDVGVGTVIANRTRREVEGLIGFFVNTLVLRTDIAGNPRFRELVRREREVALGAYAHQEVPFEKLVEEINPDRDLSRSPLFQVMMVLESAKQEEPEIRGLKVRAIGEESAGETGIWDWEETGTAKFDLSLSLIEKKTGIAGALEYSTDLYEAETIRRMARHYERTVAEAVRDAWQRGREIELMRDEEKRQILEQWNETEKAYEETRSVPEMIEEQAARSPEAVAVADGLEQLTYRQLNERANRLARYLRGLGVGPEVIVGLYMERSVEMIVGLLGILKAGGAYLPMDPNYPRERLEFMLRDAGVKVLVSGKAPFNGLAGGEAVRNVSLEEENDLIEQESGANLSWAALAESLAYVIYTSGSTGRPKGAQIHHGALANYIRSAVEGFELSSQDRVLQFASISFDAAAEEIYPCLATGGRLALRSKESLGAARQFLQECEQEELTVLDLPTAYWQQLVVELAAGKVELPERIRLVIIGGEKAQANSVEMWRRSVNERVVLMNTYGPTETTIVATRGALAGPGTGERATGAVVIGRSIANVETYVLDEYQRPAPLGVVGELYLGGAGVGRGYLKRAEQTAEKFVPNPYRDVVGARLYRSGDLVRRLGIGDLEFIDRVDEQVKVRGYRIELGEIRAALDEHQSVKQSVVIATDDKSGGKRIIGYVVGEAGTTPAELKKYVRERLPEYMTPEAIVVLDEMPISANGKIDRQALPIPDDVRPSLEVRYVAPQTELEQAIAAVWEELLEVSHVGIHDNFFDIGAHSLMMVQAASKLRDLVKRDLPVMKLFQYPTVSALAGFLNQGQLDSTLRRNGDSAGDHQESVAARKLGDSGRTSAPANDMALAESNGHRAASLKRPLDIAIIGMSGRFPQAPTIDVFWRNLCDAHEGISALSDSQLLTAGVDPSLLSDPRYVKAAASLDGIDLFDASFFGFSPREAEILDPQHRLFLQAAWHALESAGYVPDRFPGRIGLFAGAGFHFYLLSALRSNPEILTSGGFFQASISNEKDFLPTRVSYKLNLRGPSMAVQTACSTSLVTVHLACQSLLNGECDMALAGGVRIITPPGTGYFYEEGGVESADGHCRAFDAQASGTVGGDGLGIVVLKRLAEARADGDNILAVIKGSAVNNDGSGKVGYTAPSVDGQAQVISEAQAMAGIDPATITYVETHGTATALGDPIEIAALTQAFGAATDKTGFCAIGSVKTNIGHLDTAAGVAGLIKTALALKHRQIPASLHFKQPNPQIDFANSPFYVNTELRDWVTNGVPRRAGVSSFGIGGTNAHLILEEASEAGPSEPVDGWQVLALSARSDRALDAMATRLAAHLKQHPELNLADVAYTLQEGRKAFAYRLSVVCRDLSEAVSMLEEKGRERRLYRRVTGERATPVVFVFPGQGAQYVGMGRELYEQEPVYRSVIDRCAETMKEESGIDLRTTLYPDPPGQSGGPDLPDPPDLPGLEDAARAAELINQTGMTQMALFAVELGLARMWQSKGVQPAAMIGHSLGEYVAACLAGVISDEQAMRLVAKRGALMQHARPGVMLAVALSESELREHLRKAGSRVEVAAVNGPKQCVVSGEEDEIVEFERSLAELGIAGKRLKTSHAFHSRMMEEAVEEYGRVVAGVEWARPMISYISNVSGTWVRPEDAQTPGYWRRQMREPVRFWEGLEQIGREIKERVFLEVGPGETLSRLARQLTADRSPGGVATLGPRATDGARAVMEAVGNLWANGADIQWEKWRKGKRRRVELPGYPFEEKRYWVGGERPESELLKQKVGVENWFYVPLWKETASVIKRQERKAAQRWLIMEDKGGIGERIALELERQGCVVTRVKRAERYERRGEREYRIRQREAGDCQALLKDLERRGELPEKILHLFNLNRANDKGTLGWEERIEEAAEEGFYSLVYIAQAIGQMAGVKEAEVVVVSNGVVEVGGEEDLRAEKSMVMGPVRVMRQEYPQLRSRYIDVLIPPAGTRREEILIEQLLEDLTTESADQVIAYRGNHRWAQTYEPVRLATAPAGAGLRPEGHYLITGGLGGIGMALAEHLARSVKARLVLTGREGLPARDEWDRLMEEAGTDEKIRRKISKIRELEELGAKVEVISADVSDETQMKEVARRSRRRFGPLNGVIHAAGITNEQAIGLLQEVTPARSSSLFRPKVHGLFVLEKILRGADLDFCILFSSLSSVLGGVGFAAYSASNIFMDAFVRHHNRNSAVPWISVNWDGWRLTEKDDQQPAGPGSAQAELAMEPRDGVEAFQRIISMKMAGQVIVSTGDLEARMRRWIRLESLDGESTRNRPVQLPGHSRPELQTSYVAPRNDLERTIAAIWQDLLGIEQIGVHDNFFELGGHSLLAIQCLSRLRQAFQVEIPIRSLFENPTIVGNGEVIEEALIKEINALTEDEVLSLQEER
ncbi:MAG: amino acid adenylation domain-containing protein [Blastocatellia bacterium]